MSQKPTKELIEDYLDGKLTGQNLRDFEAAIQSDSALAQEVEDHRTAFEALDLLVERSLKSKLKELQKEREQKARFTRKPTRVFAIAASVAILVMALGYILINQQYSDQALFAANFERVEAESNRGDAGIETQFTAGLEAFNAQNWDQAIQFLRTIPESDPNYGEAQFFTGQAFLETAKTEDARKAFQYLIDQNDIRYSDRAEWFLALSFLKDQNETAFRSSLQKIESTSGHAYQDKAIRMLKKLDSFWR